MCLLFDASPIPTGEEYALTAGAQQGPLVQYDDSLRTLPLNGILAVACSAEMLLIHFWEKIATFEALDHAIILASECYVTNTLVQHRYIVLELCYDHQTFWIRLDRRRGQNSLIAFIFASSASPSHDTVSCSSTNRL